MPQPVFAPLRPAHLPTPARRPRQLLHLGRFAALLLGSCPLVGAELATPPTATRQATEAPTPGLQAGDWLGVWKGSGRGSGALIGDDEELPVTLLVERGPKGLRLTAVIQGTELDPIDAPAPAGAVWDLNGRFKFVPFALRLESGTGGLRGSIQGLGVHVAFEAQHILPEVLQQRSAPSATGGVVKLADLQDSDWEDDLCYLASMLPQLHAGPFQRLAAQDWWSHVEHVSLELPESDVDRKVVLLTQLVARLGDAHTGVRWRNLPQLAPAGVRFHFYADGLFVTQVQPGYEQLLGQRVARIGAHDLATSFAAIDGLHAAENPAWQRSRRLNVLVFPRVLHALGVVPDAGELPLTVELEDGATIQVVLPAAASGTRSVCPDPDIVSPPLWLTRSDENYWWTELAEPNAIYLAYNSCAEDPSQPIVPFAAEALNRFDERAARRFIIDLRHNGGGNSAILGNLIRALGERDQTRDRGWLQVLIGPRTFSSAVMNAHELRTRAGALLVGEATGGSPNGYGEVRSLQLPRSGLRVQYSTKYFRLLEGEHDSIVPDALVPVRSGEAFFGRDPVLEHALGG